MLSKFETHDFHHSSSAFIRVHLTKKFDIKVRPCALRSHFGSLHFFGIAIVQSWLETLLIDTEMLILKTPFQS